MVHQQDHESFSDKLMYRLFTEHRGVLTIHIPRAEPEGVYSQ